MEKIVASRGTVGKALDIMDLVARAGKPVRFTELLEPSRLPKATLFRFLRTLCDQDMLVHDPETRTYSLGMRLVRLAHAAWSQASLTDLASRHLDVLVNRVGETVHLARLENGQVLYIDKRTTGNVINMFSQPGKVGPAYCTGVGKAMLAFLDQPGRSQALEQQSYFAYTDRTLTSAARLDRELDEIRETGIALDREEHEPGIICIACPIRTGRHLVGALSITSSVRDQTLDGLLGYGPILQETARNIGDEAEIWHYPAIS